MSNAINYLQVFRKRSPLMQEDIAFLYGQPDSAKISRYEKGQREPTKEVLLLYHHLFNISIESFFEPESRLIKESLINRIIDLIRELRKEEQITLKNTSKIKFLEQVLIRLTN